MPQTNLGAMFKLFSTAFEPPAVSLAESLVSGALCDDMRATWNALDLPRPAIDAFCQRLACYRQCDAPRAMHEIRRDATWMFLGDKPRVTNSEGLWRKKAEGKTNAVLVINSYSIEVAEFMRRCGVVRARGYNDCVDYVETECEFAGFLADIPQHLIEAGEDPLALLEEFMDEHMKLWIPGFCEEVERVARTVYYQELGKLLGEYIKEF